MTDPQEKYQPLTRGGCKWIRLDEKTVAVKAKSAGWFTATHRPNGELYISGRDHDYDLIPIPQPPEEVWETVYKNGAAEWIGGVYDSREKAMAGRCDTCIALQHLIIHPDGKITGDVEKLK